MECMKASYSWPQGPRSFLARNEGLPWLHSDAEVCLAASQVHLCVLENDDAVLFTFSPFTQQQVPSLALLALRCSAESLLRPHVLVLSSCILMWHSSCSFDRTWELMGTQFGHRDSGKKITQPACSVWEHCPGVFLTFLMVMRLVLYVCLVFVPRTILHMAWHMRHIRLVQRRSRQLRLSLFATPDTYTPTVTCRIWGILFLERRTVVSVNKWSQCPSHSAKFGSTI